MRLLTASLLLTGSLAARTRSLKASGEELHSIAGIQLKDDVLFVCDLFGQSIKHVDPLTLEVVGTEVSTSDGGFCDDLAFNADGTAVSWSGLIDGYVRTKNLTTGAIVDANMGPDVPFFGNPSLLIPALAGVNPITYGPDGTLWAATFFAPLVYEIDPTGVAEPVAHPLSYADAGPSPPTLNAFDFCPDGFMYAPSSGYDAIFKVLPSPVPGVPVMTLEKVADVPNPIVVKCTSDGTIYTASRSTGQVWSITGGVATQLAQVDAPVDNLVVDEADQSLFVTGNNNDITQLSMVDGSVVNDLRTPIAHPQGLAYYRSGWGPWGEHKLYVADQYRITVIDLKHWRRPTQEYRVEVDLPISGCETIAVNNDWIVCAEAQGSVSVLDRSTLALIDQFGSRTDPDGPIMEPGDVEILPTTPPTIAVTSSLLGKVYALGRTGAIGSASPATRTELATGLTGAMGLAVSNNDEYLYISTYGNAFVPGVPSGTVEKLDLDDNTLTNVASGLSQPMGIDVLECGDVVVVETGTGVLTRLDESGFNLGGTVVDELDVDLPRLTSWANPYPATTDFVGVAASDNHFFKRIFITENNVADVGSEITAVSIIF